jgi:hypothetical protein
MRSVSQAHYLHIGGDNFPGHTGPPDCCSPSQDARARNNRFFEEKVLLDDDFVQLIAGKIGEGAGEIREGAGEIRGASAVVKHQFIDYTTNW